MVGNTGRCAVTSRVSGVRSMTSAVGGWGRLDWLPATWLELAAKQALQQRGGFGEAAGLNEAGGSQQVGAVWGLVHQKASW